MISLYTWRTPNGRKISIALEELGLRYTAHAIDIGAGEQYTPDFLALNPNNKIPVIVDADGPDGAPVTVFESGAILLYLAEKTGKLLPSEPRARLDVLQWLMLQMGGVGPMLGQAHHFLRYAPERLPYAMERYRNEARRLYGVLDQRLHDHEWLAGGAYSIADIATYPWIARHEWHEIALDDFPAVARWFATISQRPAVERGMRVPA